MLVSYGSQYCDGVIEEIIILTIGRLKKERNENELPVIFHLDFCRRAIVSGIATKQGIGIEKSLFKDCVNQSKVLPIAAAVPLSLDYSPQSSISFISNFLSDFLS